MFHQEDCLKLSERLEIPLKFLQRLSLVQTELLTEITLQIPSYCKHSVEEIDLDTLKGFIPKIEYLNVI